MIYDQREQLVDMLWRVIQGEPAYTHKFRACKSCGGQFQYRNGNQQFCSARCRSRYFGGTRW